MDVFSVSYDFYIYLYTPQRVIQWQSVLCTQRSSADTSTPQLKGEKRMSARVAAEEPIFMDLEERKLFDDLPEDLSAEFMNK